MIHLDVVLSGMDTAVTTIPLILIILLWLTRTWSVDQRAEMSIECFMMVIGLAKERDYDGFRNDLGCLGGSLRFIIMLLASGDGGMLGDE